MDFAEFWNFEHIQIRIFPDVGLGPDVDTPTVTALGLDGRTRVTFPPASPGTGSEAHARGFVQLEIKSMDVDGCWWMLMDGQELRKQSVWTQAIFFLQSSSRKSQVFKQSPHHHCHCPCAWLSTVIYLSDQKQAHQESRFWDEHVTGQIRAYEYQNRINAPLRTWIGPVFKPMPYAILCPPCWGQVINNPSLLAWSNAAARML